VPSDHPAKGDYVGDCWVDSYTAERYEWDGERWWNLGPNPDLHLAEQTKPASPDACLLPSEEDDRG
jgi:hypothetical protein